MANCADNSYVIYYTNLDKGTIQIQRSALVTDELDIALIGKSRLEYGEIFNENTVHLLENFACPESSPGVPDVSIAFGNLLENPTEGQIWYNKTQKNPFVYIEGDGWIPISTMDDVAGASGVVDTSNFPFIIPPVGFTVEECVWNVSPYYLPSDVDYVECFALQDGTQIRVTMDYRTIGGTVEAGFANFQILGIRNHVNHGSVDNTCTSDLNPPSPTPAASFTPTPTITPTITTSPAITPPPTATMTATVTPSITPSPSPGESPTPTSSVTPTVTLTPTITPSSYVDNGDIFAFAIRPNDPLLTDEVYYVRKLQLSDEFDVGYSDVVTYSPEYNTTIPTYAKRGMAFRQHYLTLTNNTINVFDLNLNSGMNNFRSYESGDSEFKVSAFTTDDQYIYAVFKDSESNISSEIRTMYFNGDEFNFENVNLLLPNENVQAIYTLDQHKILTVSETGTPGEYLYRVIVKSGEFLIPDVSTLTLADSTPNVAVLNPETIVITNSTNEIVAYTFSDLSGFTFIANRDYSALSDGTVQAVQADALTGKLFVAYAEASPSTDTMFECLLVEAESIGGTITVEQSTPLAVPYAVSSPHSISVHGSKLLALDITDPLAPELDYISYGSGGFSLLDTIALSPANRESIEVGFAVPLVVDYTPTPTPSITTTSTVTPTPTPEPTPTPTPSRQLLNFIGDAITYSPAGSGQFVMVSDRANNGSTYAVATSHAGTEWNGSEPSLSFASVAWNPVESGLAALGDSGVYYSPSGLGGDWSAAGIPVGMGDLTSVKWLNATTNKLFAVGDNIISSADGITYGVSYNNPTPGTKFVDIARGLNEIIALREDKGYISTNDGVTWAELANPMPFLDEPWKSIDFSNTSGKYAAIANGTIALSGDAGNSWDVVQIPLSENWNKIRWIDSLGYFYALGTNHIMRIDSDGNTLMISPIAADFTDMAWSPDENVAVVSSRDGVVLVTSDGLAFTVETIV